MKSITKIPFNKPFIAGKELYYIEQAIRNNHCLSGNGYFTKLCQNNIESKLKCKKVLLTHSCTAALEMAAILADIGPGDEIIMPSYTFVSTANAFVLRGGIPVFVDISPHDLNIDVSLIESAITSKTKAIVPVHYAGKACDMMAIKTIAEKYNLLLIEDAAQAMLTFDSCSAKHLGTIGDMGCLSFHETKNIISGEGGALLINNDRFMERAEIIWEKGTNRRAYQQGVVDKYTWVDVGSSFLPSDMIAAFLCAQLEEADTIISKRKELCRSYHQFLEPLAETGKIVLQELPSDNSSNGHLFYIILKDHRTRTELIAFLEKHQITPAFHYVPLHSSPAGLKYGRTGSDMTHTDDLSARVLRLPLFFEMNTIEVRHVCDLIKTFYKMDQ